MWGWEVEERDGGDWWGEVLGDMGGDRGSLAEAKELGIAAHAAEERYLGDA